jgi:uncharacterized Zn finger protein (UPF0148 family)
MLNCHRCGGIPPKMSNDSGFIVCPTCNQSVHVTLWDQMQHALRAEHRMELINSLMRGGNYTGPGAIEVADFTLTELFGKV